MRKLSADERKDILKKHKLWLEDNPNGERADLHDAKLTGVDLCNADLTGAKLFGADLHDADLHDAKLFGADLHGANLFGARLPNADLHGANLFGARLPNADLTGVRLTSADLFGANLHGAKLTNVQFNEETRFFTLSCPEEGSFIGYKKACDKIVVLEISADAKRSSATSYKCRCSKAKVLRIENLDGSIAAETSVPSNYDKDFIYTVGEIVEVKNFNEDRWIECAEGIHFFISKDLARIYS